MCLAIPGTVISIEGNTAMVNIRGLINQASLQLIEGVEINDYVLIHCGFIIEKISYEEAQETINIISQILDQENSDNHNDTKHEK